MCVYLSRPVSGIAGTTLWVQQGIANGGGTTHFPGAVNPAGRLASVGGLASTGPGGSVDGGSDGRGGGMNGGPDPGPPSTPPGVGAPPSSGSAQGSGDNHTHIFMPVYFANIQARTFDPLGCTGESSTGGQSLQSCQTCNRCEPTDTQGGEGDPGNDTAADDDFGDGDDDSGDDDGPDAGDGGDDAGLSLG